MQYYIDSSHLSDILYRVLWDLDYSPAWIKAGIYKGALDLRIQRKTDNLK